MGRVIHFGDELETQELLASRLAHFEGELVEQLQGSDPPLLFGLVVGELDQTAEDVVTAVLLTHERGQLQDYIAGALFDLLRGVDQEILEELQDGRVHDLRLVVIALLEEGLAEGPEAVQ